MYSSKVVLISWAVVLGVAAATALFKKNMTALGFIVSGGATVALGVGIERGLANEIGAIVLSLCLLAGALATLLGIIRLFPR
ncbi:MAG: hypothetical protein QNJ04_13170 [Desulfobacterales bacterium]|nr:hypothetical protein [Desulfobacterales bacterium]